MQEMIPFVGPRTDIIGPDMGTNEQVMAWFMDTYSVYQGYAVPEIVTGKPVAVGGTAGRREATGRGVVYLVERALNVLKMQPDQCTAVVQGFGNVGAVTALGLAYKSGMKVIGISDATRRLTIARAASTSAPRNAHARKHGSLAGLHRRRSDSAGRTAHAAVRCARARRGRSASSPSTTPASSAAASSPKRPTVRPRRPRTASSSSAGTRSSSSRTSSATRAA